MTGVYAGFTESVHERTLEDVYRQHIVEVEGQTDILTLGVPFISPYNPESIMNPILVMCVGLGYMFNMYRNKPLVREGGVIIMTHPTYRDLSCHHPSYIDFFDEASADTTDPAVMSEKWESGTPKTSGIATSTEPVTPITAFIRSTPGTGARMVSSGPAKSSSLEVTPTGGDVWDSPLRRRWTMRLSWQAMLLAAPLPLPTFTYRLFSLPT